ncbi:uncharacterized protein LOC128756590 [Synchiropus splendidus]|uniref:uncharacterized protein LOC128756590 n=1 Tax=Synchiropus splendidus TaxID=270530 RepID=UPI00237D7DBB|nr:uncharacterized protein LOC128756590 [Synchiropus splendidus]
MSCWRKDTPGSSRSVDRLGDVSKAAILRQIVTEKLSSGAQEILAVVERTIVGYEEDALGYRRELERQKRLLECLLQPRVKLERNDVQEEDLGFIWYGDDSSPFDEDTLAPENLSARQKQEDPKDPDFEISESCRTSTPKVPSERRVTKPWFREEKDHIFLRVRVLDDTLTALPKNDPMQLWCPTGLQEMDFLRMLHSTIPQLTDNQACTCT